MTMLNDLTVDIANHNLDTLYHTKISTILITGNGMGDMRNYPNMCGVVVTKLLEGLAIELGRSSRDVVPMHCMASNMIPVRLKDCIDASLDGEEKKLGYHEKLPFVILKILDSLYPHALKGEHLREFVGYYSKSIKSIIEEYGIIMLTETK